MKAQKEQEYTKPNAWTDEEWTSLMSAKGYDIREMIEEDGGYMMEIHEENLKNESSTNDDATYDTGTNDDGSWSVTQEEMIDLITRLGKSTSVDVGNEQYGSCFIHFESIILEFDNACGMDGVQVDISLIMNRYGAWDNRRKLVFTHPSDKVRCSFIPLANYNDERRLKPVFICRIESLEEYPIAPWDISDDPENDTEEAKRLYDLSVSTYIEKFEDLRSADPFIMDI